MPKQLPPIFKAVFPMGWFCKYSSCCFAHAKSHPATETEQIPEYSDKENARSFFSTESTILPTGIHRMLKIAISRRIFSSLLSSSKCAT